MKVKEITLDCGTFLIYEDYMVGTIFEGADFNEECKYKIWDICKTNFENRSFGYISNRIHSYSVDPTIYLDTSKKFEKLKAIAVVSKGKMHRSNFQLEKQFFKSPLMLFEELNEAKTWMAEQLNYSNSSSLST
ncbi:hypothetical protein [Croceibacter atlanticus]|jgi:hypothetical protein|uniref:STAS/SEC14 domain-containing protein n=1 Tax=Croceibacter atlanticus (strain ATCC BAA-628 / JCM 21780 / CIP 108009 / IAM 15332 / KCTC 12090 / HTCC2559) TaxID=216432 RepID=A3U9V3_CROAH|nr:hypothetical protein [Croceibacter atlanticus]EAP86589.1 hypothetical protein CA2559_11153 [Croceibacter atlanticus HTCC2559]MAM23463.1 STAS/SEC14 domain-containing protein [Croceibacter sp.]WSP34257.1 STAS/SEC14 domain-containing protein [Croceibacter atlanticus]